jgi:hypothetical protein
MEVYTLQTIHKKLQSWPFKTMPIAHLIMDINYKRIILDGQTEQDKISHMASAIVLVVENIV